MNDPMLPLPGLSPASGKPVVVKFDGGLLSSDGGVLALREVEQRFRLADRLAACMVDPRDPDQVTHSLADIIRFRLLMISAGYEDGNDANCLRSDPMFKMALDLSPSDRELCSQSTISRLENLPNVRALLRMGRAMVDLYCESFRKVPKRITLDIDDTFDAVHGGQQLRLLNAHYDEYGFQPIVVFDGEGRFITAVLRPAKRPGGKEIKAFLRRLLRAIRANDGETTKIDVSTIALPPWFVPEMRSVSEQLKAFRRRKTHFALVVDEYGEVEGMVTLEDILEEIVGDISDEHDVVVAGVRTQPDGSVVVDGSVPIRDLNRAMDWHLPDEEATTVAGLVIHEARSIPERGQSFTFHGFRFRVLRRERNRITALRIVAIPRETELEEKKPKRAGTAF